MAFFELLTVFLAGFRYRHEKGKTQKRIFPKYKYLGPQLCWRGLIWYLLNSSKAHAPRGLDKNSHENCCKENGLKYFPSKILLLFYINVFCYGNISPRNHFGNMNNLLHCSYLFGVYRVHRYNRTK